MKLKRKSKMESINKLWKICSLMVILFYAVNNSQAQNKIIKTGKQMRDTNGNLINAHGGGILFYKGIYYWYGEIKKGKTSRVANTDWEDFRVNAGGISCYSSSDLKNWRYEGVALAPDMIDSLNDLHFTKVIERPKVIYNSKTNQFVMWMHIDNQMYSAARSGVATSNSPIGPFHYINSKRPNNNMARDMTLFQDEDGRAFYFFSSEDNATMHICLLTDDYLKCTQYEQRIMINQKREAPAVFKYNKKYYLISSGCTGWIPNAAAYAVADSIMGEWKYLDNPCTGANSANTYHSQSTYVLKLPGANNQYLFMADRWNKNNLEKSTYLWLPMIMNSEGEPKILYKKKWNLANIKP